MKVLALISLENSTLNREDRVFGVLFCFLIRILVRLENFLNTGIQASSELYIKYIENKEILLSMEDNKIYGTCFVKQCHKLKIKIDSVSPGMKHSQTVIKEREMSRLYL